MVLGTAIRKKNVKRPVEIDADRVAPATAHQSTCIRTRKVGPNSSFPLTQEFAAKSRGQTVITRMIQQMHQWSARSMRSVTQNNPWTPKCQLSADPPATIKYEGQKMRNKGAQTVLCTRFVPFVIVPNSLKTASATARVVRVTCEKKKKKFDESKSLETQNKNEHDRVE